MKIKDLPKNKNKSVRINQEILAMVENQGFTLQGFLDLQLEKFFTVDIKEIEKEIKKRGQ